MRIHSSAPQVRVHFYTERGNIVTVSSALPDGRGRDQLISVTTEKDLGHPAGHFSVTLTAEAFRVPGIPEPFVSRRTWAQLVQPGDLVVIEMGPDRPQPADTWYAKNWVKGSGTMEVVMVGSVDSLTTSASWSDGKPHRSVTISGRDMGKYLVDDVVFYSPWWDPIEERQQLQPVLNLLAESGVGGVPAFVMNLFLTNWFFQRYDVAFDLRAPGEMKSSPARKLSEILRQALDAGTPAVAYVNSLMAYEGSPWALFQGMQAPPWYTLWVDTRRRADADLLLSYTDSRVEQGGSPFNSSKSTWDSQVALIYRRNPWSNRFYDDWTTLPTRVVTDQDLVSETLTTTLDEVATRWRAIPSALAQTRVAGSETTLLRDAESERRFGIRPRILNCPFFAEKSGDVDLENLAVQLEQRLRDWDRHNIQLLSGRLVTKGMAAVKVGDRLFYNPGGDGKSGLDFYVESVGQEFINFDGWQTTLGVTRGQPHRDRGQLLFKPDGTSYDLSAGEFLI